MADNIRISVELKEDGRVSLKDYVNNLKRANLASEDLKKAYSNLGKVASAQIVRMSQITDELSQGIANASQQVRNLSSFKSFTSLSTNALGASQSIKNLDDRTKAAQTSLVTFVNTSKSVSKGYSNIASSSSKAISSIRNLDSTTKSAQASLVTFGKSINKASSGYGSLASSGSKVVSSIRNIDSATKKSNISLVTFGRTTQEIAKISSRSASIIKLAWSGAALLLANFTRNLVFSLRDAAKSALNLASDFQGYRNALAVASDATVDIDKRIASANNQINVSIGIATKYKLSIVSVTKAYSKFVSALSLTNVPLEQAQGHFENFAKFARVANLSGQATSGMFLALEQMVSKGVVSMEELRRQLGEHLPGAVNIAAQAMGKGTSEFIKQVSRGEVKSIELIQKLGATLSKRVDPLIEESLKKFSANVEALNNEWTRLKITLGDFATKVINPILQGFTDLLKIINSYTNSIGEIDNAIKAVKEGGDDASDSLDNLRQITGDFTSSTSGVIAVAENMKKGFSEASISSLGFSNQIGLLAIGMISTKAIFSLFLKPLGFILKGFSKLKATVAPAAKSLKFFSKLNLDKHLLKIGTAAGKLVGIFKFVLKRSPWIALASAIGFVGKEAFNAFNITNSVTGNFEENFGKIDSGTKEATKSLEEYNNALLDIKTTLSGVTQTQAILNLETNKAAKIYTNQSSELQSLIDSRSQLAQYMQSILDTGANEEQLKPFTDAFIKYNELINNATIETEEARQAFSGFSRAALDTANSLREVNNSLSDKQSEKVSKRIKDLAIDFAVLNKTLTKSEGSVLKMEFPLGDPNVQGLIKMMDLVDSKRQQGRKSIKKQVDEIKKLEDVIDKQTLAETRSLSSKEMLRSEIELFNRATKFTDDILRIQTFSTNTLNDKDKKRLAILKEKVELSFKSASVSLQESIAIERQKKATDALIKSTKNQIRNMGILFDFNESLIASKFNLNRMTDLQRMKAQEDFAKREINLLESKIELLQKLPNSEQDVIRLRTQVNMLSNDLTLVSDHVSNIFEDSFKTFFEDVLNGTKSWGDALNDMFKNILQEINSLISRELASNITKSFLGVGAGAGAGAGSGSNTTSIISGLLGSILGGGSNPFTFGGAAGAVATGLANGGSVSANDPYFVGEEGPELFIPKANGKIVSNDKLGGNTIINNINIQAPEGNISRQSMNQLQSSIGNGIQRSMSRNN